MKIVLCQINSLVGDCEKNFEKILNFYNKSILLKPDIIVFPELSMVGYPPQDLLFENGLINDNLHFLNKIANLSTIPIILGFVRRDGDQLFNSAAICFDGEIQDTYDKILIPTYDVFDESRYFKSGKLKNLFEIPLNNSTIKVGIQICEDLWDSGYGYKVSKEQKDLGAQLIINISSSPFSLNRTLERFDAISYKIDDLNIPFVYCNMVGGQDELIFDGASMALNNKGHLIAEGKSFEEDLIFVDFKKLKKNKLKVYSKEEQVYNALCLGVKDYFSKTNHSNALIGLSGGIDSALVTCIASEALGASKVHTVSLPSKYSSSHSIEDAKRLSDSLEVDHRIIEIVDTVNTLENTLKPHFVGYNIDVTEENIQARVRGNILMALSNKFNWMLLSTGNKTEIALGYCTLYGDMSGGLSVISDLNKIDVYSLANWINKKYPNRIPRNTIEKLPSAELATDQFDPFDYEIISPLVDAIIEERKSPEELIKSGFDKMLVISTYNRIRFMEYKRRQSPIGLRISKKAFGMGRRMPIVNHYKGFQND